MHTSVENALGSAFGKKNESLALACFCFIVQSSEALGCGCLCQRVGQRMGALCAGKQGFALARSPNPAASHRTGCLDPLQDSLPPVLGRPLPLQAGPEDSSWIRRALAPWEARCPRARLHKARAQAPRRQAFPLRSCVPQWKGGRPGKSGSQCLAV